MSPEDRARFFEVIVAAAEIYGRQLSAAGLMLYWQALLRYDIAAVEAAVSRHINDPDAGQYMPKPADIVKQVDGGTEDRALIAFTKVERAVRSVGVYRTVVFDDPLIHAVVSDMGGWLKLCSVTDDELPFVRNEFVTRFRGYGARQLIPEHPTRLIGIVEAENARHGYRHTEIAYIGDRGRAEEVAAGRFLPDPNTPERLALNGHAA